MDQKQIDQLETEESMFVQTAARHRQRRGDTHLARRHALNALLFGSARSESSGT